MDSEAQWAAVMRERAKEKMACARRWRDLCRMGGVEPGLACQGVEGAWMQDEATRLAIEKQKAAVGGG